MAVTCLIQHEGSLQQPVLVKATLTLKRKNTPGQLNFTVVKDAALTLEEGDAVRLTVDDVTVFYGFVFTKDRDPGPLLEATAYDQLRYLKNKDTFIGEGLKASDLVRRLAGDFRLNLGTVEDTGCTLETIVEENQTLFDMIQNALDETLKATGKLYVLRDEAGALCLREIETLKLDLLIDAQSAQTFRYSSSIDRETCNKIKLTCNNPDTGKRELYIAQDGEALNRWGVLQYFETVQSPAGAAARADALLGLYNRKTRTLKVQKAFGDPRVGGGSSVVVLLELDDGVTLSQYMVVEQVVHTFAEGVHRMDLDLIGGNFTA
ncbi:MAG: hydrolase [Candidatus Faecalibacterium intestinavium]|uniref:Hydrolase n=1 Tax=Candidatus Faecalibacterium intestinavium TaxID=2838580 RepID=A0A9E2NQQ4_9FIRM|nr:hydrolase [Candidatus Faecalibacterium intestinavium]